MYDNLTLQKLYSDGVSGDSVLRSKMEAIASKPRYLDGPPEKYSPVCKSTDSEPFGAYAQFRRMFEYLKVRKTEIQSSCTVYIDERPIACDFESYLVLRTLMECGMSRSSAKAKACRDLFKTIVKAKSITGIDKSQIASAVRPGGDYYVNEIINAIFDCLFTDREKVVISLKDSLGDKYEDDIPGLLGDPEDLEELEKRIRLFYKKACASQEFRVRKHLGRVVNVVNYLREVGT